MRGKTVRRVADIGSVQPQGYTAFDPLKGNKRPFTLHILRQPEIFHIAGNGIIVLRKFTGPDIFQSVPWIFGIAVLRRTVTFKLDMGRHTDIFPSPAVKFRLFKSGNHLCRADGMKKLPLAVQVQSVSRMNRVIRMRIQSVFTKKSRIFQSAFIKKHIQYTSLVFLCKQYTTGAGFFQGQE